MKDTPTNSKMNIALLSIPLALVGISVAIVPIAVAMKLQSKSTTKDHTTAQVEAWPVGSDEREFERAA